MNFSTSFVSPASDRPSWRKKQCLSQKYLIYYKKEKHFDFLGSNIKKLSIPWQDLLHLLGGLLLFLDAVRRKNFDRSHVHTATFALNFFLIFTVQHLHFMEDFLHWKNATKKLTNQNCTLGVDRSSHERESWALFALAWPATPTDQGAADKVELYFYLHFISLYLYLYLQLHLHMHLYLPKLSIDGKGGWSASTQEPQRYQSALFV